MLKLKQALDLSNDLVSESYMNTLGFFHKEEEEEVVIVQTLESWKDYMEQRIFSFFSDFEKEVGELEIEKINKYQPQVTKLLQNLSLTLHQDYNDINRLINDINSHEAILENGEEVNIDGLGNIIDHKITRQEVRDLLKNGQERGSNNSEIINKKLKELVSEIELGIDEIRHSQVDTFEDFYVIAIREYSENIMATDFSSSTFNEADMSEWRAYAKIKKNLIKKRDELTQFKPSLLKLDKLLGEIKFTLKTFEHEQGSYYALLRAKANIEFQTREQRESDELELIERGKIVENEEEIVGTLTQTVLKIQTVSATTEETSHEEEKSSSIMEEVDIIQGDIVSDSIKHEKSSKNLKKKKNSNKLRNKHESSSTEGKKQTIAAAVQEEYNIGDF